MALPWLRRSHQWPPPSHWPWLKSKDLNSTNKYRKEGLRTRKPNIGWTCWPQSSQFKLVLLSFIAIAASFHANQGIARKLKQSPASVCGCDATSDHISWGCGRGYQDASYRDEISKAAANMLANCGSNSPGPMELCSFIIHCPSCHRLPVLKWQTELSEKQVITVSKGMTKSIFSIENKAEVFGASFQRFGSGVHLPPPQANAPIGSELIF